jgi:hypothetical protein
MTSSNGNHKRVPSIDPFSHPDVYYGDEDSLARIRDRRRAFSTVSSHHARAATPRIDDPCSHFFYVLLEREGLRSRRDLGVSGYFAVETG